MPRSILTTMSDHTIGAILARVRANHGCRVSDLADLVPAAYRNIDAWAPEYLKNPLAVLMRWGLIEAKEGQNRLTPEEVVQRQVSLSDDFQNVLFYISQTAAEIEDALGYDCWIRTESIFGQPSPGAWPLLFVLMPFSENLRPVFDDHIMVIAKELGLDAGRADDFFSPDSIMRDIWSAICTSQVVIADCTGRNPNVFYETGIAHALGKKTILISQVLDDVPFDLRHLRVIVYEYTPRGMKEFEETLRGTLQSILRPGRL
jgi:hypothetical protein